MIRAILKSQWAEYSKQEKIIAEYLVKLEKDPSSLTSSSISNELGISQSTVIRFTQKLGYTSFRTFLIDLSRVYTSDLKVKERSEKENGSIKKLVLKYEDAIHETYSLNSEATVQEAKQIISKADRIVIFGAASSSLFAEHLANQLNKTGLFIQFTKGYHSTMVSISQISPNGLVILLSQSGETKETLQIAKYCKIHEIPILALTGKHKNSLNCYSSLTLFSSDFSRNDLKIRISQLFLVDMLVQELTERT